MRYFADIYDADGKAYVFDSENAGSECAGPYDTLNEAKTKAAILNKPPKLAMAVETGASGDFFLSRTTDVMAALSDAVKDGRCTIEIRQGTTLVWYRVELLDGDEYGEGPDLETALRYALGAHYSP